MPPKAEVFVAEDEQSWQDNYARWLPRGDHHVAGTITHVFKAADTIGDLRESGTRIDVAIVDGNIGFSKDGRDGAAVVDILRREFPDIKIIGATFDPAGVKGADVNINKNEMSPSGLVKVVTEL